MCQLGKLDIVVREMPSVQKSDIKLPLASVTNSSETQAGPIKEEDIPEVSHVPVDSENEYEPEEEDDLSPIKLQERNAFGQWKAFIYEYIPLKPFALISSSAHSLKFLNVWKEHATS